MNTVDVRYFEYGLFRAFAFSNKIFNPYSFYAAYFEPCYYEHFAFQTFLPVPWHKYHPLIRTVVEK